MQRQHLNQYIKFIYTENVVRVVLFVALLWPPKIYFDRWVFYFSVYGERQIFICSAANVTITVCYTLINSAIIQKKNRINFFSCHFTTAGIYLLTVNRNTRTGVKYVQVNIKDTRTMPLEPFWLTYFTPCSSVPIVNFEHVIASWDKNFKIIRLRCNLFNIFFGTAKNFLYLYGSYILNLKE